MSDDLIISPEYDFCVACGCAFDPQDVVLRVINDLCPDGVPDHTCLACIQAGADAPADDAPPPDAATIRADQVIDDIAQAVGHYLEETQDDDPRINAYHHARIAGTLSKAISVMAKGLFKDVGDPRVANTEMAYIFGRWQGLWGGAVMCNNEAEKIVRQINAFDIVAKTQRSDTDG